jgi:hypothetical protein
MSECLTVNFNSPVEIEFEDLPVWHICAGQVASEIQGIEEKKLPGFFRDFRASECWRKKSS